MLPKSILLPIDGSLASHDAADLCWRVAASAGAQLLAQHVIDVKGLRDLVEPKVPGFIASEKYKAAHHVVCEQVRALSKDLEEAYIVGAARHGIRPHFQIDEGDPVEEISRRARFHDLVVMGHRSQESARPYSRSYSRLSVAEALAHDCPSPLLIVQNDVPDLKTMTIMLSTEHVNEKYIDACLELAELLEIEPSILCVYTDEQQEHPDSFIEYLRKANPNLENIPIETRSLEDMIASKDGMFAEHIPLSIALDNKDLTLPVMPTRKIGTQRVTILGGSPGLFVRFLNLPTLLLFPEEHVSSTRRRAPSTLSTNV